jgi:hypothetical protein
LFLSHQILPVVDCSRQNAQLETMQYNAFSMTDFLINQKSLHIRSLITGQLNDIANLVVLLHGTVATEVLLESLANSLNIQIVCQTSYCCDTLSAVTLLDTNVNLSFRITTSIVSGVFERVYSKKNVKIRCTRVSRTTVKGKHIAQHLPNVLNCIVVIMAGLWFLLYS